jgi:hypothetical protein
MPVDRSRLDEAVVEWLEHGPGAGNGLDHVRLLFIRVYPGWGRGDATRLAASCGVGIDIIQRVFKKNPAWTSGPSPRVVNDLAKVLMLPARVVLFAFLADVYPEAVDEDMWCVLDKIAHMPTMELMQVHQLR